MSEDKKDDDSGTRRGSKVIPRNVTTASGKNLRPTDNPFMFKNVKIITG
jgi:hypothetical protein